MPNQSHGRRLLRGSSSNDVERRGGLADGPSRGRESMAGLVIPISGDIGRTLETVGFDIPIFGADRRIGGADSDERVETDAFVIWGEGPTPISEGLDGCGITPADICLLPGLDGRSIDGVIPI